MRARPYSKEAGERFLRGWRTDQAIYKIITQPFFTCCDEELAAVRNKYGLDVFIFSQDAHAVVLFDGTCHQGE